MKKKYLLSTIMIVVLFMSLTPPSTGQQSANFNLRLIFASAKQYQNQIASVTQKSWAPLGVDVSTEGYLKASYLTQVANGEFDVALLELSQSTGFYPPIDNTYSPSSATGEDIYSLSETIASSAGVNRTDLISVLNDYTSATTLKEKKSIASEFQHKFNSEWFLDIPLVSKTRTLLQWDDFEGYDVDEGLLQSLALGASWVNNPDARKDKDKRSVRDLHYTSYTFEGINIPFFIETDGEVTVYETMYSTLMKMDKNGTLHPDLATSFNHTILENGHSKWEFNITNDATWSQNDEPLDTEDIKFTYDILSFDHIATTNGRNWENLHDIKIIDNNTISIEFTDARIDNKLKFTDNYILPEHILNNTFTTNSGETNPYLDNPKNSDTWKNYPINPVTAGPYEYNSAESTSTIVAVSKRSDYWYPNENKSPNNIFNVSKSSSQSAYYYENEELSINDIYFHLKELQDVDDNPLINSFTTGSQDIIELNYLPHGSDLITNDKFDIHSKPVPGSGLVMIFNLETSTLKNADIRKALTLALNRNDMAKVSGYGQKAQRNPISHIYPTFYNTSTELRYNYPAARNIFRSYGYAALENPTGGEDIEWPWEKANIDFPSFYIFPSLISLVILTSYIRRRN